MLCAAILSVTTFDGLDNVSPSIRGTSGDISRGGIDGGDTYEGVGVVQQEGIMDAGNRDLGVDAEIELEGKGLAMDTGICGRELGPASDGRVTLAGSGGRASVVVDMLGRG